MYLLQKTSIIITCLFLSSLLYSFSDAIVTRISITRTPSPSPKDPFVKSRPTVTPSTTSGWPTPSPSPSRGTANTGHVANDDRQSTSKSSSASSARPSSGNPTKNLVLRLWTLDAASLYVNGVKLASIETDIGGEVLVSHPITIGDVISIRSFTASPFDGGIALSVKLGFSWVVIGHGFVRSKQVAVTASDQERDSNWMFPGFNACIWKPSVTVSIMGDAFSHMLMLRGQLDYDKTEYRVHQCRFQPAEIVQSQQGQKDILEKHKNVAPRYTYHRIVVGGDKCEDSQSCVPGKCLWLQDNFLTGKEQDDGQSEQQNDGKKRCRCRQEQTPSSQNRPSCYTLTGKTARWIGKLKAVCKKRPCFAKYECVSGSVAEAQWCIIKYATHRTKAVRKWYGNQYLCENEKLNHTEPFLAPYDTRLEHPTKLHAMRTVESSDGLTILVGENANENDQICADARQNDLWFHLDGKPSPHVLLSIPQLKGKAKTQMQNNININNNPFSQSIHEACQLVKHFSSDRNASQSTVNMVQAKFVSRKGPESPGMVVLKKSPQNVSVITDQSTLDGLLDRITRQ